MRAGHDGPVPAWFEDWLEAEQEALTLRYWQPIIIPGLFQTADYARALLLAAQSDTSHEAIDALVTARLPRRAIVGKPDPPDVVVVLDEAVLHRLIGSAEVMCGQLADLVELSARPCISVQVVPGGNGANAGLGGSLNIASGDGTPGVVHMDAVEGQTTERQAPRWRASSYSGNGGECVEVGGHSAGNRILVRDTKTVPVPHCGSPPPHGAGSPTGSSRTLRYPSRSPPGTGISLESPSPLSSSGWERSHAVGLAVRDVP